MTALITLNNVAVRYPSPAGHRHQDYSVFDGINLTLQRGERLGVVGRNGAGKSTLLRIMAKIFSHLIQARSRAPDITVSLLSLLGFAGLYRARKRLNRLPAAGLYQARRQLGLSTIQEFCEIGDFFDAPVRTYSTACVRGLALLRRLRIAPDVILIDETLGVGDAVFKEKAQDTLKGR